MAGRKLPHIFNHRASYLAVFVVIVAILGVVSVISSRRVAAESSSLAETNGTLYPMGPLAGLRFEQTDGVRGVVVGEFEGSFDAATREIRIQGGKSRSSERTKRGETYSRFDPGSDIPLGSGFSFSVVASTFVATGDNPGTV